jgi:hypothetical protein
MWRLDGLLAMLALDRAATSDEVQHHKHKADDQGEVDDRADGLEDEQPEQPKDDKDDTDGCEHGASPLPGLTA